MTATLSTRATARDWLGLVVLVIPALLASMDLSVLFMASPWIGADLAPTASQHLWIMDIYGFVMAGLLVTMGSVGDRIGRRRLLLIGAAAFGAASLLAAFATSAGMLIIARALLGLGGATLAPSTLSLIRGMFLDDNQRRAAVGVWTAAFTGGVAIGPIIGGLLLERFFWGSVFLINVPFMALLFLTAPFILRESRDPRPGRFDLLGSALSLAAVLPVIYGIKQLAEHGFAWPPVFVCGVGVAFGGLFAFRQLTAEKPMIDIRLFRHAGFSASIMSSTVVTFAAAGMGLLAVTFIQTVLGYAPFPAALWMLPTVVGSFAGVALASALGRTIRPGILVPTGLAIASAGFLLVSTATPDTSIALIIAPYSLLTLGVGMTATLVTSVVLTTAPPEKAGAASALAETSNEFGGAVGIALLGTLASAVYRSTMRGNPPPGIDPAAGNDTIGEAVAVASQLPPDLAVPLLDRAFEAFTDGFSAAAIVGAAVLAGVAILVATLLGRLRTDQIGREHTKAGEPLQSRPDS